MNKQELIEYCEYLKGDLNKFINGIDVNKIIAKIEQLDEPQKVTIPWFIADWITYCKDRGATLGYALFCPEQARDEKVYEWLTESTKNQEKLALAWINGCEVKKCKKYSVKFKNIQSGTSFLKYDLVIDKFYFGIYQSSDTTRLYHTEEELKKAGFEWVFFCEGVEVGEAE